MDTDGYFDNMSMWRCFTAMRASARCLSVWLNRETDERYAPLAIEMQRIVAALDKGFDLERERRKLRKLSRELTATIGIYAPYAAESRCIANAFDRLDLSEIGETLKEQAAA